jgi:tRNA-dihydrouridine synthase
MSAPDAVLMLRETGCDFVMMARGALGNPWIFEDAVALWRGEEIDPPPPAVAPRRGARERVRMFIRHARMLEADKGEYIAVREMRKHAAWYFKGLPGAAALRAKVNAVKSMPALTALVSDAFPGA